VRGKSKKNNRKGKKYKKYGRIGNEKCENKGNAIIRRTGNVFPSLL
jgi:hypothetical protein